MGKSWLPLKDEGLQTFCNAFQSTITAAPVSWGLSAGDLAALDSANSTYNDAMGTVAEGSTRTPVAVATKRAAKKNLITLMRNLYKKVLAANLTDAQLEALNLPIRDTEPSPIAKPTKKPAIGIKSRDENIVTIDIFDPTDPNRRAKPEGVDSIAVFTAVAEEAPNTDDAWKFMGTSTRTTVALEFPTTLEPGSKIWITAIYQNPRGQEGPPATPVSTYLPGGAAMAA
jgi:hypothetical protein